MQRAEQEPALRGLRGVCTGLMSDLRELKKGNQDLTESIEGLKKEKNDLSEQAVRFAFG
jgi:hypothetical protein